MSEMKVMATVIGDVVGSRDVTDRADLHDRLVAAIGAVNDQLAPLVPLRITVGDEYQGGFATVGEALVAALRVRLLAAPGFDLRHGIGWGPTTVLSGEPRVEDGPGWWAAREAIGAVAGKQAPGSALRANRALRTAYRRAEESADGPDPAAINAALASRDALLDAASQASWGVLRDLLNGMTQREIAEAEGVSASAVSQRIRRDGLAALVVTDELLGQVS